MKKIKFIIFNIFVIIHTVFIFAYAVETKNTPASVPPSSAAPTSVQPQIQEQVQAEKMPDSNYKYYPLGKPDPFQPFMDVDIATKKKKKKRSQLIRWKGMKLKNSNCQELLVIL